MSGVAPKIRRRARERATQYLFGFAFTGETSEDIRAEFWEAFPSKPSVREYANKVIDGVHTNIEALDAAINGALKNWSPERVGRIERSVLRVAVYETAFERDVPRKVALNEAIEVVREFGGEDAARFVNGVLDRVRFPLDQSVATTAENGEPADDSGTA